MSIDPNAIFDLNLVFLKIEWLIDEHVAILPLCL